MEVLGKVINGKLYKRWFSSFIIIVHIYNERKGKKVKCVNNRIISFDASIII